MSQSIFASFLTVMLFALLAIWAPCLEYLASWLHAFKADAADTALAENEAPTASSAR
ncbi:hypothetical protein [Acidipila sp. EB88]|uniref:hypothetical protein n=1 Tax=Acidipila sp. EB88 TaxID=2305226 RepID=UPI0013151513|nr:hypothetical protein [Acidipila sp. EB88]